MLPVVILAGGFGTRLKSVVGDFPKVLAPVAGKPFLHHLLIRLEDEGVRDVVVSTGHMGEQVAEFVAAHTPDGRQFQCIQESEPLGTGGALAFTAREAGINGAFIAMNGDTFFGGSLRELAETYRANPDASAILALTLVETADRYGRVLFDDSDDRRLVRVTGFSEKEKTQTGDAPVWINAGVYVLTSDVLEAIPANKSVSLEREVFPRLVEQGALKGMRFPEATFLDIGTPEDYARASQMLG